MLREGLLHIQRAGGKRPLSLVLAPIPTATNTWVAREPRWLLLVFDPDQRTSLSTDLVQQDLNLSPREADVAVRLAAGMSLQSIARELNVSLQTVRAHLKAVFQKTQLHTQADIVRRIVTGPGAQGSHHDRS